MVTTDLIIWRDSFNIGYERVDDQHRQLVKLINDLYQVHSSSNKDPIMIQIFLELYSYTVNHFSMEELLMKQYGYKNLAEHMAEHNSFLEKIDGFKSKYLDGNTRINLDILNYLKDWLLNHIIGTDKKTFDTLKNKLL